jgi:uncharacterized YigZ family protein
MPLATDLQPAPTAHQPARYRVPAGTAQAEIVVKNSVFVATVGHAADASAAQRFIAQVKGAQAGANHHAWAYRLCEGAQMLIASSDDGEPGGTAGRPMLAILQGSGLLEIVAVCSRFFGGIKLGTGGLVRAYGGAVRQALLELPVTERVLHYLTEISIDYTLYTILQHQLVRYAVRVEDRDFAEEVTLRLAIPAEQVRAAREALANLTSGRVTLDGTWLGERYYPVDIGAEA